MAESDSSVDHRPEKGEGTWVFDEEVAAVFDDMLDRSVPGYSRAMDLIAKVIERQLRGNARIADFGCSTAKAFQVIEAQQPNNRNVYFGVDEAQPMLDKAKVNFAKGNYHCCTVEEFSKRLKPYEINCAILSLTLQFVPIEHRQEIIANICADLPEGGLVFLFEKCLGHNNEAERLWTDLYYDHKNAMGYSWDSIMEKRQSLENVLVPLTVQWNEDLLRNEGLRVIHLSSWCNFHLWVGIK